MQLLRHALAFVTLAILPAGAIPAETAKKASPEGIKKSTPAQSQGNTAAKKGDATGSKKGATSAGRSTATRKGATSTKGRTASRYPQRSRQMQPTSDRYREIQQALAGKGYLKSEPNGSWNEESVEALRRFQQDQHINPSGRIDSLSLIALGLGPKRSAGAVPPRAPDPKPDAQAPAAN